jgi:hypothetical protein
MADIDPVVRQMILCDRVVPNTTNPQKHDTLGLIHTTNPNPPDRYPTTLPVLCVYLQLTGGRGSGTVQVVAVEADTGDAVFSSAAHSVTYPADPLLVFPMVFRISSCKFPRAGLYWIQFRNNGRELAAQPLLVR